MLLIEINVHVNRPDVREKLLFLDRSVPRLQKKFIHGVAELILEKQRKLVESAEKSLFIVQVKLYRRVVELLVKDDKRHVVLRRLVLGDRLVKDNV